MTCRYTLLLRYGSNRFYLAPRVNIEIEENLEQVETASCCGSLKNRTWTIKAHFVGNCSLATAWALFRALETFLDEACSEDLVLERTVCDEPALIYKVTKVTPRMVDVINQYIKQRILTMEITFGLTTWTETGEGAVILAN